MKILIGIRAVASILLSACAIVASSEVSADFQYRFKVPGVRATSDSSEPQDQPTDFDPCPGFRIDGSNTCRFGFTGETEEFIVPPTGVITIKGWGAGGGGAKLYNGSNPFGGGGGYATRSLSLASGTPLSVVVGGGGDHISNVSGYIGGGGYNGGGHGALRDGAGRPWSSAGGGGRSEVLDGSLELLVAAGGGGASGVSHGGAGGGAAGEDAQVHSSGDHGRGATQSVGGSAGRTGSPGAKGQGGRGQWHGGGGGGGYYGGGGGGQNGGGGGGSSYAPDGSTTGGSGRVPGMASDPDYVTGIGYGGDVMHDGADGLVVITW